MRFPIALASLMLSTPAAAQLRAVPEQPASLSAAKRGVEVVLINDGPVDVAGAAPARIEVTTADAARIALVPMARPPATIPARSFARVRYVAAGVIAVDVREIPPPPALPSTETRAAERPPLPPPPGIAIPPAAMRTEPLPPSSVEAAPSPPAIRSPTATRMRPPTAPTPVTTAQSTVWRRTLVTANGTSAGFLDRFIPHGSPGLKASAAQENRPKPTVTARGNPVTAKGAEAFAAVPLASLGNAGIRRVRTARYRLWRSA